MTQISPPSQSLYSSNDKWTQSTCRSHKINLLSRYLRTYGQVETWGTYVCWYPSVKLHDTTVHNHVRVIFTVLINYYSFLTFRGQFSAWSQTGTDWRSAFWRTLIYQTFSLATLANPRSLDSIVSHLNNDSCKTSVFVEAVHVITLHFLIWLTERYNVTQVLIWAEAFVTLSDASEMLTPAHSVLLIPY